MEMHNTTEWQHLHSICQNQTASQALTVTHWPTTLCALLLEDDSLLLQPGSGVPPLARVVEACASDQGVKP